MAYVILPAPAAAVPVVGSPALFPVRRVYCVGQNYAEHVAEMGGDGRQPPFFFAKPNDALVPGTSGAGAAGACSSSANRDRFMPRILRRAAQKASSPGHNRRGPAAAQERVYGLRRIL